MLIVESVTPERCILQRHSIRQSFGAMIREDYQDIPIRFDTFHVASALGSYPEAGDILEIREDTAIAQYRKSPCYVGTIGFADDSQKQPEPGMLRRIGNILESGKVGAFDIHVAAGTPGDKNSPDTWQLRNGSFTDTYIAWNPAWKQVKTGDVVSFGMYYDYPVMPLPAEQGYEHTYLAVESIGAGECILRNQEYGGVRMPYDLLITCLGEEPRLGDVLELMPEAHFVTEPGDANSDETVDIMDVMTTQKSIMGCRELTPQQKADADVDQNGVVDSADSLNILKYVVGMIDSFDEIAAK